MGMGLAGMGGAAGAGDALATLFDQRLRAAADQRAQQQQQIQQQEFHQNQARLDALTRIAAQEKADTTARLLQQDHDQQTTRLNTQLSAIPQGTSISAGTQQSMVQGGVLPERFQPTPITPQGPPPSLAAVDQPPAEPMAGTVANSPAPAARTFQRTPTDKETAQQKLLALFPVGSKERSAVEYNIGTGGDNMPAGLLPKPPGAGVVHDTAKGLVRIADDNSVTPLGVQGYHPPKTDPDSALVKVEHKGPDGRTIIEYLPKGEVRGKTYDKAIPGAVENRLASAEAVNQTGNDIIAKISTPQFAATLGPAMGRAGTLRDFLGNPPPEFSEFAGLVESYSLANMGVHGMRSSQGAEKIKALLDAHHTPESLAAAIRGLNGFSTHFLENEGRTVPKAAGTIFARDPQGKLHQAKAGTALPAGWKEEQGPK